MLPAKLPKKQKRASRWRCPAHAKFVREHACSRCGGTEGIEAAHVRMGSGAGMGQKPDDYRLVSLCAACHRTGGPTAQHNQGERAFWKGVNVEGIIDAFNKASPRRREIEQAMKERGHG